MTGIDVRKLEVVHLWCEFTKPCEDKSTKSWLKLSLYYLF